MLNNCYHGRSPVGGRDTIPIHPSALLVAAGRTGPVALAGVTSADFGMVADLGSASNATGLAAGAATVNCPVVDAGM